MLPASQGVPVKPTTVTGIRTTNSTVSFNVGRLGDPVLVKVPYFPNWHATGALGPYEVSPNLMAVVPTAHHVTFSYGTTGADQLGKLASLGGVVGLGVLIELRPPAMRPPTGSPETPPQPAREDESEDDLTGHPEDENERDGSSHEALPGGPGSAAAVRPGPEARDVDVSGEEATGERDPDLSR